MTCRAGVVASALAVSSIALLGACGQNKQQNVATGALPEVAVVTLKTEPVRLTRELPGRASAYLVAEVRPQVSGIVKRRLFTEGGYVEAGQPLYDLDDARYRAQYGSAQASLRKSQATLVAARLAAKRSRELIVTNVVSAQDNDKVIAAEGEAEADVGAAQSAVEAAAVNLAYAHIKAPISGRIGKSAVTAGALVTAEQSTALATIQQLDPIYVEVKQSSSDWLALRQAVDTGRVRSNQAATARIVLENGTVYDYEGKVQFADVTVDPTTGGFLLRAIVPNPKLLLLPGMYVRSSFDEGELREGLLVPQQGIARDPKGNASALLVGRDGKVELRTVRVSRTIGDQWLAEEGLAAGDRVIVEGIQKVEPGMRVQAVDKNMARSASADSPAPPSPSSAFNPPH